MASQVFSAPTIQPDPKPYLLNVYIRNAALKKEPIFDSFKKLCETQAKPNLDYVDFEWKYYQFYNGNQDLTIERSPENSSPLMFVDLPMDVLEKVVEKSSLVDRLVLRKVSRDLRNVIDTAKTYCEKISFELLESFARITLEDLTMIYRPTDTYACRVEVERGIMKKKYYGCYPNSEQAMVMDVAPILKNPKLKIGTLILANERSSELTDFLKLLDSLGFQLNVRSIDITKLPLMRLSKIFENFQPKVLEEISWNLHKDCAHLMDDLFEMEQWKQAKTVHWKGISRAFTMVAHLVFPRMLHFKKIRLELLEFCAEKLHLFKVLYKSFHLQTESEFHVNRSSSPHVITYRLFSQDPADDRKRGRFSIRNYNVDWDYGKLNEKFRFAIEIVSQN